MSVAAISSSDAASAIRSRSKVAPRTMPDGRREAQAQRVDRVEQVRLVLLQVLVVGQRQRVQHAVHRGQVADDARGLRAQQLGRVRVLLLRHDRAAARPGVGEPDEAELLARPEHELGAEAREVRRAGRRGADPVEDEVAVGDGVERVRRDAVEAELGGDHPAVGVEVHAGERARAERQVRDLRPGEAEALAVALEHPDVREQVVPEVDRLRALQVRVARAAASRRAPRAASSSADIRSSIRSIASSAASRTNSATSVATWSLRERAVWSLPPTGPAISVRRRSTAMWMSSSSSRNGKRPVAQLGLDGVEAREQRVAVGVRR